MDRLPKIHYMNHVQSMSDQGLNLGSNQHVIIEPSESIHLIMAVIAKI